MGKRDTTTTHRFCEWVLTATWHGYTVTQYRSEQEAINAIRDDTHYMTDWYAFRQQSPCPMAHDVGEAILDYYRGMYGML